jgi:hypothetical protein
MAALNPNANIAPVLDFTVAEPVKFYHLAIKGLEDYSLYELTGVLIVATADTPAGENLIRNYGKITMAECTAASTIRFSPSLGRPTQNATMLYHYLYASLTKSSLTKFNLRKETFTIWTHVDGVCFLRAIVNKAQLDTIRTVKSFCKQLNNLQVKIVELSGNIKDFHQQVDTITGALDSYGMEYRELILNLFDTYKKVENNQFLTYIMITRFGYIAAPNTYNAQTLLSSVENQYKMRVPAGTWMPSIASQQVSALAALTAKSDALTTTKGKTGKGKERFDSNGKNAWKYIVPKEGDSKSKMYDSRQYHWCPRHGFRTVHQPEE